MGGLVAASVVMARPGDVSRTSMARSREDGRVIEISTGSSAGRCWSRGTSMICEDRDRLVRADVDEGCLEAAGGAHCEIVDRGGPARSGASAQGFEGSSSTAGAAGSSSATEAVGSSGSDSVDPASPSTPVEISFPVVVSEGANVIDIECEKGSKSGNVYTISDTDGSGGCSYEQDVDKRVIGGSCTKKGAPCTAVNCDHGCDNASAGCECHLKSSRRRVQTSQ